MSKLKEEGTVSAEDLKESVLYAAQESRASDIHIDPGPDSMIIRLRIDGVLEFIGDRPIIDYENFVSHLKVISNLDITQHTIPQEGHFVWAASEGVKDGEKIKRRVLDIRCSFFPTVYGEAVVMRILNRTDLLISLKDLGFSEEKDFKAVKKMIHKTHGMVLVTGPANAGKTTTLYSILKELSGDNVNIMTIEDPVEYYMERVRQSQIVPHQGYTYEVGIKSVLRQDPDVIMIGEIRDLETAENSIRVSLTGRMVLSTLHSNTSVGAVSRLLDMNVERDLVAYALSGVIGQRLVRKVCTNCRTSYTPSPDVLKILNMDPSETFFKGEGCKECLDSGFYGRSVLFEILNIDEDIRALILNKASASEIEKLAIEKGLKTIREDGIQKIRAGITSPEEVIRATA
ncbi:MAG: general secretion pathway protein GspE [Candidatus Niyogibacteria bacterium CG10_big_fil_rev_8_21_14_0_10_42_19]|uniref:General secretion pathway protein GspE n=1 Tax=Candidatus Niyogibacteria bacterium CG10_big_fil_rev_8_21_14_0_10_42_19 TaxID=1974725 RepID=A0A2H0TF83_9BACT|nr:MAG: general secretion pathway protein GspE [Candidatus Niyogibacteria bacterium CG10_big_fil_rev_8_21_14_0_10_42_19]